MYTDQDSNRKEFGTDYLAALSFWGKFKNEKAAEDKAIEIIKITEKILAELCWYTLMVQEIMSQSVLRKTMTPGVYLLTKALLIMNLTSQVQLHTKSICD